MGLIFCFQMSTHSFENRYKLDYKLLISLLESARTANFGYAQLTLAECSRRWH